MERCIKCGHSVLTERKAELEKTVAGRTVRGTVNATECDSCGDLFYELDDVARFELRVAAELAKEGPTTGEALRFMRKSLGLPSTELASLLGVTPESVSRWEHGKLRLDRRTFALVGLMVLDRLEGRSTVNDVLRGLEGERAA